MIHGLLFVLSKLTDLLKILKAMLDMRHSLSGVFYDTCIFVLKVDQFTIA